MVVTNTGIQVPITNKKCGDYEYHVKLKMHRGTTNGTSFKGLIVNLSSIKNVENLENSL